MKMNRVRLDTVVLDARPLNDEDVFVPVLVDKSARARQRARLSASLEEYVGRCGPLPQDQVDALAARVSLWAD